MRYRCSGESWQGQGGFFWPGCGRVFESDEDPFCCPFCWATFCGFECCGNWASDIYTCDFHLDCEGSERVSGKFLKHENQRQAK